MRSSNINPTQRVTHTLSVLLATAIIAGAVVGACASEQPPRTITLATLNDSGVTGTVAFRGVADRTEVSVSVDPGGNPDMPAHIHPGTCDSLTPQPKFPLENV
ncbi:MAG: hypothetical protein ACRDIL_11100, partial [Candidatus Limnocylindrales bacterium]